MAGRKWSNYQFYPDSPYTTDKHTNPPPIQPQNPRNSAANIVANRAAATGSIANKMAVSVGFNIFCAHIIIRNAIKVANTPVIMIAKVNLPDQIMASGSKT